MKLRLVIVLGMVGLLFAACRKDLNDNEQPVAQILLPQGETYTDTIPLQLSFSDNKNLLQYRISITYTGVTDPLDTNLAVSPFNYLYVGDIANSLDQKLLKLPIPDTALSGNYRVLLTCVDESAIESKADTGTFTLINLADTIKPALSNIQPAANTNYLSTDSVIVSALAVDDNTLTYYSVKMVDSTGSQKAIVQQYNNTNAIAIDGVLRWNALPIGNYAIYFTARDAYYNTQIVVIPIYLH